MSQVDVQPIEIVGIRRAGTGYVSNLITSTGVSRSSVNITDGRCQEIKAVHIVRDPRTCIASLQTLTPNEWDDIALIIRQVKISDDPLRRAMMYYYHGNKLCQRVMKQRIKVEDITPGEMRRLFNVDVREADLSNIPNQRDHKTIVWADLKRTDIRAAKAVADLSRIYGYDSPIIKASSICAGCI